MRFEYNRIKYVGVQRLMNINIATAFQTTSSEAHSILARRVSIIIRTEEAVKQYFLRKGTPSIDLEVEPKNWQHPAEVAAFIVGKEYGTKPYR